MSKKRDLMDIRGRMARKQQDVVLCGGVTYVGIVAGPPR